MAWRVQAGALPLLRRYADCVLTDLMPGFGDVGDRADLFAETEFERLCQETVNEDGDMGALADQAQEAGLRFHETMKGLQQGSLNLFTAGLFHLLEQGLAELCWDGAFRIPEPRDTKLSVVADWYQRHLGLSLQSLPDWTHVDELRLLANAVKHAEGGSARELRQRRPDLFIDPSIPPELVPHAAMRPRLRAPLAGDELYVTPQILRTYSDRAVSFFESIRSHFLAHRDHPYPIP